MATGGYHITLKALVAGFSIAGVLLSFLTFTIGRASVVSDLREEIATKYVLKDQYLTDQNQLASTLSELSQQNKDLDKKITSILMMLTGNRKVVADNLIAEPD